MNQPSRPGDWRHWKYLPAASAATLAIVLYASTLGGTYVYDDVKILQYDSRLTTFSEWPQIWTHDYFNGGVDNLYRPLITQTYAIEWMIHGDRPWIFHAINILLHAAASAAVAEWLRRLCGAKTAWIGGLLFAAHPVHVEAVANIVGRAESASTLAIVCAMILLLHRPLTAPRAAAAIALMLTAILCKEQGFLLAILLPATIWLAWRKSGNAMAANSRETTARESGDAIATKASAAGAEAATNADDLHQPISHAEWKNVQLLFLGACWASAGIIVLREEILKLSFAWERTFLDYTINPLIRCQGIDKLLAPLAILGRYVVLLILPTRLSPDYGYAVTGWHVEASDGYLWLGVAALVAWGALMAIALLRKARVTTLMLLGLGLSYAMIGNLFVIIGTNMGERLMYLPSVFFIGLIAMALSRPRPAAMAPILTIVLALACLRTATAAPMWNDRLSFYQSSLAGQPKSIRLYMLTAKELDLHQRYDDAMAVIDKGIAVAPTYMNLWALGGQIELHKGDIDKAWTYLCKAKAINPLVQVTADYQQVMSIRDARSAAAAASQKPATRPD
jgi:tetratricopeptide (TPR) repeat protein